MVLAIGAIFILYLALNSSDIGPAEWAQILLLAGLVAVTGIYAMSATRQADASAKMAEETREQRYSECLPLLVPEIPNIADATDSEDAYSRLQNASLFRRSIHHSLGFGLIR